jgi:DEAD/DEAH box helicase domain-containing protein
VRESAIVDHVVVDVEIQRCVEDVPGGWNATDQLGVAVACVWEYRTGRMRVYGPDDVPALVDRLLKASRISGYNIWNFDFPVILGVKKQDWVDAVVAENLLTDPEGDTKNLQWVKAKLGVRCDDLLRRIWVAQGFDPDVWQSGMGGTKLDEVAGATIGARKIGNGADAPKWFQAGQVQRVVNYCADDVAIERDLSDFVDRYGYVVVNRKQLFLKGRGA